MLQPFALVSNIHWRLDTCFYWNVQWNVLFYNYDVLCTVMEKNIIVNKIYFTIPNFCCESGFVDTIHNFCCFCYTLQWRVSLNPGWALMEAERSQIHSWVEVFYEMDQILVRLIGNININFIQQVNSCINGKKLL